MRYPQQRDSTFRMFGDPPAETTSHPRGLLVEGLGVGGGGRNVGIAGSLVRAGGELELVGSLEVGVAGLAVGAGVILEVEKLADHLQDSYN
jgi:hypothetical protein